MPVRSCCDNSEYGHGLFSFSSSIFVLNDFFSLAVRELEGQNLAVPDQKQLLRKIQKIKQMLMISYGQTLLALMGLVRGQVVAR